MIIDNLDVRGSSRHPTETDTELVVDANAVLAGSIAGERFQAIAWRDAQITQSKGDLQLPKLSLGHCFDVPKPLDSAAPR
jgi:hypothetical protein